MKMKLTLLVALMALTSFGTITALQCYICPKTGCEEGIGDLKECSGDGRQTCKKHVQDGVTIRECYPYLTLMKEKPFCGASGGSVTCYCYTDGCNGSRKFIGGFAVTTLALIILRVVI